MLRTFHRCILTATLLAALPMASASAGTIFKIDIDSNDDIGPVTASGWDGVNVNTGATVVDGVTFVPDGGSRTRSSGGSPNPDALLADFVFATEVRLEIEDLPEGIWEAEVWSWDGDFNVTGDPQIIGIQDSSNEVIKTSSFTANPDNPFTFQFDTADFANPFSVFVRTDEMNRARLNAVQLTRIPEPASLAMLGVGGVMLLTRRRRA